jgi:putative transcriptional regulator
MPDDPQPLTGMLLVAMPGMPDPRFAHSVIYLCAHSADGAMGLIVNRPADSVTFPAVVDQLGIKPTPGCNDTPVHVGGPVEANRGFVLHSCDYRLESTLVIDENFALTATVDVLRAIAGGRGPRRRVLALGYAGWAAGQLEDEIRDGSWFVLDAAPGDAFSEDPGDLWRAVLRRQPSELAFVASFPDDPTLN